MQINTVNHFTMSFIFLETNKYRIFKNKIDLIKKELSNSINKKKFFLR